MEIAPDPEPRTQLGADMRDRLHGLKAPREPIEATPEQREEWTKLGRERFRDPDHQRWAQSHRSRESLQEAGRLGYQATARKYGHDFADRFSAEWRRENPTEPERRMMELLNSLGFKEGCDYEREGEVGGRRVDFAFHDRKVAIEVYGGVHEDRFRERYGTVESGAEEDRRHNDDVQASGYRLLIIWGREMQGESLDRKREEIQDILAGPAYGHDNPWA